MNKIESPAPRTKKTWHLWLTRDNGRFFVENLMTPLQWGGILTVLVKPDLFSGRLSFQEIASVFGIMASTPHHRFLLTTRNAEQPQAFFQWAEAQDAGLDGSAGLLHCLSEALTAEAILGQGEDLHAKHCADPSGMWPLPNVVISQAPEKIERASIGKHVDCDCASCRPWTT